MTGDAQPAPLSAAEHGQAGLDAERAGDLARALPHFEAALAYAPSAPKWRFELARVLKGLGRLDEAERHLRWLLDARPHDPKVLSALARLLGSRGDHDQAVEMLEAALLAVPGQASITAELSRALQAAAAAAERRGDRAATLLRLDRAGELDPGNLKVQLGRARLLPLLGRATEAEAACKAACRIDPQDARPRIALAGLLQARGDSAGALALLRAALGLSNLAGAEATIGCLLVEAGAPEDALTYLGTTAPPAAMLRVARTARRHGRGEAAATLLRRVAACCPDHTALMIEAAKEWQALGHRDEARALLEQVVHAVPENAVAWLRLGLVHRAATPSGSAPALACFQKAAEHNPDSVEPWVEAAREQLRLGQAAAAESGLRQALARDRASPVALRFAVQFLRAMGEAGQARQLCAQLPAEQPGFDWLLDERLGLATGLGDWDEAFRILDMSDTLRGPRARTAAKRIAILIRRGHNEDAARHLSEARQAWPEDEDLWQQRFDLHLKLGEIGAARAMLDAPPAFADHAAARLTTARGQVAEAEWRLDEAMALYDAALALKPMGRATSEWLARLHLFRNDADSALRVLRDSARARAGTERAGGRIPRASHGVIGQLTNEYRLDAAVVRALQDAEAIPLADRLPRLLEIAGEAPTHTAPAIAVLQALRRLGLFRRPTPPSAGPGGRGLSTIPRRIAQFWDTPTPPADVLEMMATWRDVNPGFDYARHDLAGAQAYLAAHYPSDVSRAFRVARHAAHKADIFRLAVLFREGGFYADADDRCIRPLATLLRPGLSCLLYQEYLGTIANNFIGVVPGHPLIAAALRSAVDATNEGRVDLLWLETGPGLLSRCLVAQFIKSARPLPEALQDLDVLFHTELRQVVSFHCGATYKTTPRNWQFIGRSRPKPRLSDELQDLLGLVPDQRG